MGYQEISINRMALLKHSLAIIIIVIVILATINRLVWHVLRLLSLLCP